MVSPRPKQPVGISREMYLGALEDLGLTPAARRTAELLGITVRQAQRLAAGDQQVTDTIALLLAMYLRHGIPVEESSASATQSAPASARKRAAAPRRSGLMPSNRRARA